MADSHHSVRPKKQAKNKKAVTSATLTAGVFHIERSVLKSDVRMSASPTLTYKPVRRSYVVCHAVLQREPDRRKSCYFLPDFSCLMAHPERACMCCTEANKGLKETSHAAYSEVIAQRARRDCVGLPRWGQ